MCIHSYANIWATQTQIGGRTSRDTTFPVFRPSYYFEISPLLLPKFAKGWWTSVFFLKLMCLSSFRKSQLPKAEWSRVKGPTCPIVWLCRGCSGKWAPFRVGWRCCHRDPGEGVSSACLPWLQTLSSLDPIEIDLILNQILHCFAKSVSVTFLVCVIKCLADIIEGRIGSFRLGFQGFRSTGVGGQSRIVPFQGNRGSSYKLLSLVAAGRQTELGWNQSWAASSDVHTAPGSHLCHPGSTRNTP